MGRGDQTCQRDSWACRRSHWCTAARAWPARWAAPPVTRRPRGCRAHSHNYITRNMFVFLWKLYFFTWQKIKWRANRASYWRLMPHCNIMERSPDINNCQVSHVTSCGPLLTSIDLIKVKRIYCVGSIGTHKFNMQKPNLVTQVHEKEKSRKGDPRL